MRMIAYTTSQDGSRSVVDIVEPKQRYARKFFRSFTLMLRRGEITDFTVGSIAAWPYDQRRFTPTTLGA